jgi:conjugative relaxase-like TrwC/TraI family protein
MYLAKFKMDKVGYFVEEELITKTSAQCYSNYLNSDAVLKPYWYGSGLQSVGLKKGTSVEEEALVKLLMAHLPKGSRRRFDKLLKKTNQKQRKKGISPSNGADLSVGVEFVLSAVKSFSILFALETPKQKERLMKAHIKAVEAALDEMESKAAYARRGHGGKTHEKVKGLSFAIYTHVTSRAIDPQAHSHILIPSKFVPRTDGTFGAIEERHLHVWKNKLNKVYLGKLAENVRALGYDTISTETAFEILGIPELLIDLFSKRRNELLLDAEEKGGTSANARNISARNTRAKKKVHNIDDLFSRWVEEAASYNFAIEDIERLRKRSVGLHVNDLELSEFPELTPEFLATKLVETKSSFTEPEAYKYAVDLALKSGQPVAIALKSVELMLVSDLVQELDSSSRFKRDFTTKAILKKEHAVIRDAQRLAENTSAKGLGWDELISIEKQYDIELSHEQRDAVLCAIDKPKLSIINGSAGSGKSTIMRLVNDIYSADNRQVFGVAVAKAAANNLNSEAGIPSKTIAKFLGELTKDNSTIRFGDVLVVDEAGQVGLNDAALLLKYANKIGFKIIFLGDDRQLEAISLGGILRYLSRDSVVGSSRINNIIRQTNEWDRKAVMHLRDGNAKQAILLYKQHNRLSIIDKQSDAITELVDDWRRYTELNIKAKPLVIARTWRDVASLNEQLRKVYIERGLVGNENMLIKGRVGNRTIEFKLSIGERIRLTKNDYKLGLTNGDIVTVEAISPLDSKLPTLTLKKSDGTQIYLDLTEYSDARNLSYIVPSYAQTIYSAQGQTVKDKVFVLNDKGIDRANAYVALSRHKSECHLYVAKEDLGIDQTADDSQVLDLLTQHYNKDRYNKLAIERTQLGIDAKSKGIQNDVPFTEKELEFS